jgi:S-adenosylmethionine:tRNA ribosyltransferase-isomerase
LIEVLRPGDLVIANDAATLPASFQGEHHPSGKAVEVRLAGHTSFASEDIHRFSAIIFGAGDFHLRTEDRSLPPVLAVGDRLTLGPLRATIIGTLDHPRFVQLAFDGSSDAIWGGIAHYGRPIQYSHVQAPLELWDVWTSFAGPPVAFEVPSAGFALDWKTVEAMRGKGIHFATVTHAAGISSTGDPQLDARLPLDEAYFIPRSVADAIGQAQARGNRIIAIGTTVVRALEDAARFDGIVRPGKGLARQRIDRATRLRVIDAILSGTHEPGTSHHDLLRAFIDDVSLRCMDEALNAHGYRTHEFGDSIYIERQEREDSEVNQGGTAEKRR